MERIDASLLVNWVFKWEKCDHVQTLSLRRIRARDIIAKQGSSKICVFDFTLKFSCEASSDNNLRWSRTFYEQLATKLNCNENWNQITILELSILTQRKEQPKIFSLK